MIIVSLTTISSRNETCYQTVQSIVKQSVQPDRIIVWVSAEPYLLDKGIQDVPAWVNDLNQGKPTVEFRWTKNTGPYRKLLPSLHEFATDDCIVVVDDDVVYGRDWLKSLLECAKKHPESVICARVRKVQRNTFGFAKSYLTWPVIQVSEKLESDFVITGCGGYLIQNKKFRPEFLDVEAALKVCRTADDLWFSAMIEHSGYSVFTCPNALDGMIFLDADDSLYQINVWNKRRVLGLFSYTRIQKYLSFWGISACVNDKLLSSLKRYLRGLN